MVGRDHRARRMVGRARRARREKREDNSRVERADRVVFQTELTEFTELINGMCRMNVALTGGRSDSEWSPFGACGATTKTGESMSRLTATWLCRVRTLPRLRRAVRTRHRQPCGSHRFAGHECPPARDTNKHEPL